MTLLPTRAQRQRQRTGASMTHHLGHATERVHLLPEKNSDWSRLPFRSLVWSTLQGCTSQCQMEEMTHNLKKLDEVLVPSLPTISKGCWKESILMILFLPVSIGLKVLQPVSISFIFTLKILTNICLFIRTRHQSYLRMYSKKTNKHRCK